MDELKAIILVGAKAAREIGKSRERTFAIGDGLLALRTQCLMAMGKEGVNDRTILKSGKYRDLMGKALKTYPDYTLSTVFKNDSTRLAYAWCAENRTQIETVFAQEEVKNPGATLRICNPERIKSKFKSLTDPPRKKKATKEAAALEAAKEQDELFRKLKDDAINSRRQYDELFGQYSEVLAAANEWKRKYEALRSQIEEQGATVADDRPLSQMGNMPKPKRKAKTKKPLDNQEAVN